jgi:hypothetical protein
MAIILTQRKETGRIAFAAAPQVVILHSFVVILHTFAVILSLSKGAQRKTQNSKK